jgi:hypothetical protein
MGKADCWLMECGIGLNECRKLEVQGVNGAMGVTLSGGECKCQGCSGQRKSERKARTRTTTNNTGTRQQVPIIHMREDVIAKSVGSWVLWRMIIGQHV